MIWNLWERLLMRLLKIFFIFFTLTALTIPQPKGYINDFANIISSYHINEMNKIIEDLRDKGLAEIAILTINNLEGEEINNFSQKVFDEWKIGDRETDNGLLIILSVEDRKIRIQTGYGLEGILPDGMIGEILDKKAVPYFKKGEYSEGIYQIILEIQRVLTNDAKVDKRKKKKDEPAVLFIIAVIIFLIALKILSMRRRMGFNYYGGFGGFGGGFGGFGGGGFDGFSGFGGGSSGGGGAGRSW